MRLLGSIYQARVRSRFALLQRQWCSKVYYDTKWLVNAYGDAIIVKIIVKLVIAMLINNPQICVLIFGSPPWVYTSAP